MKKERGRLYTVLLALMLVALAFLIALLVGRVHVYEHLQDNKIGRVWITVCIACFFFVVVEILLIVFYRRGSILRRKAELTQEALRMSETEYRIAFSHNTENRVLRYDLMADTLYLRDEAGNFGAPQHVIFNASESLIKDGTISPESVEDARVFFDNMHKGLPQGQCLVKIRSFKGEYLWQECNFTFIRGEDFRPSFCVITLKNVTEQRERDVAYQQWQHMLQKIPREMMALYEYNLTQGTMEHEDGLFKDGFSEYKALDFDQSVAMYIRNCVFEEDQDICTHILNRDRLISAYYEQKSNFDLEFRSRMNETEFRWRHINVQTVKHPGSNDVCAYLLMTDIDELKRNEIDMKRRTEEDPLTHAMNRATFVENASWVYAYSPKGARHAMLILDIDNFKNVNDTFGHQEGDRLLVEIVQRIKSTIRREDVVARLGGDEFILFLANVPHVSLVEKKAQQLCNALRMKLGNEDEKTQYVSASIGIAIFPKDGLDFETLYANADAALYQSKENGKDGFVLYSEDMKDKGGRNLLTPIDKSTDTLQTVTLASQEEIPRHMLIVDDIQMNLDILREMFAQEYVVHVALSGEEGLKLMNQYATVLSIVLLDILMPGMDGFEVIRRMQANVRLRGIPVLVISSLDDVGSSLKAIKLGATDYVVRPFEPALVQVRVQAAVTKRENERIRAQNDYLLLQIDEEERFRSVLEGTGIIVFEYDAASQVFTYDDQTSDRLAGVYDHRPLWEIFRTDMVADTADALKVQQLIQRVAAAPEEPVQKLYLELRTAENKQNWYCMNVLKLNRDERASTKLLVTLRDVQGEMLANQKLLELYEHDALTGLYNRASFLKRADELIKKAPANTYTLAYFDIDNFKAYNDLYGHSQGDQLLNYIADCMREALQGVGFGCRISSDYFAVLYPNEVQIRERLNIRLQKTSLDYSESFLVEMHFGLYEIDEPLLPIETIYDRAAMAHKVAKKGYNVSLVRYNADMKAQYDKEREILSQMEQALAEGQFDAYLQPQYDYSTGEMTGAEALVRWIHPQKGILEPNEFVPLFEKNGFISKLDNFMCRRVCEKLRAWMDAGLKPLPIAVNLSRLDVFDPGLCDRLLALTEEFAIPKRLLHIEMTESAFVQEATLLITVIQQLRSHGFIVEMDDFGSGYSSLNLLSDIPVDILKLDMRFILEQGCKDRRETVTGYVIKMAHQLGLSVIAEGVERQEQARSLLKMGCTRMQGYHFTRPIPCSEFEELLRSQRQICVSTMEDCGE